MKALSMKPTALREYLKRLNTQVKLEQAYGDPMQVALLKEEAASVRLALAHAR
jgi:hypothetical protein